MSSQFVYFTPFFYLTIFIQPDQGSFTFPKVSTETLPNEFVKSYIKSSYPFNRQSRTKFKKYQIEYSKLVEAFHTVSECKNDIYFERCLVHELA